MFKGCQTFSFGFNHFLKSSTVLIVSGANYLTMKLTRNASSANYLRITLNSMDVYEMEFISIRGMKRTIKKKFENVYNDQLQKLFTEATGLYTSL